MIDFEIAKTWRKMFARQIELVAAGSLGNLVDRCPESLRLCFLKKFVARSQSHTLLGLGKQDEVLGPDPPPTPESARWRSRSFA